MLPRDEHGCNERSLANSFSGGLSSAVRGLRIFHFLPIDHPLFPLPIPCLPQPRLTYASVTLQTTKNDSQTRVYMGEGGEIRGLVRGGRGGGDRLSCQELINGRRFSTRERNVSSVPCVARTEDSYRWYGFIGAIVVPGKKQLDKNFGYYIYLR